MYRLYGIKNCDTVKKARKHLDSLSLDYEFIDFKKTPPLKTEIERWKKFLGDWPVNPKGRTYKMFKDEFLNSSDTEKIDLIQQNTSLIKRPVLEKDKKPLFFGYDPKSYDEI